MISLTVRKQFNYVHIYVHLQSHHYLKDRRIRQDNIKMYLKQWNIKVRKDSSVKG